MSVDVQAVPTTTPNLPCTKGKKNTLKKRKGWERSKFETEAKTLSKEL